MPAFVAGQLVRLLPTTAWLSGPAVGSVGRVVSQHRNVVEVDWYPWEEGNPIGSRRHSGWSVYDNNVEPFAFQIDDIVEAINDDHRSPPRGVPGRVVEIATPFSSQILVDFAPHRWDAGHRGNNVIRLPSPTGRHYNKREITLISRPGEVHSAAVAGDASSQPSRYPLASGDRVRMFRDAGGPGVGAMGTVLRVSGSSIGVSFDNFRHGHRLDGRCPDDSGWNLNSRELLLITPRPPIMGDRVMIADSTDTRAPGRNGIICGLIGDQVYVDFAPFLPTQGRNFKNEDVDTLPAKTGLVVSAAELIRTKPDGNRGFRPGQRVWDTSPRNETQAHRGRSGIFRGVGDARYAIVDMEPLRIPGGSRHLGDDTHLPDPTGFYVDLDDIVGVEPAGWVEPPIPEIYDVGETVELIVDYDGQRKDTEGEVVRANRQIWGDLTLRIGSRNFGIYAYMVRRTRPPEIEASKPYFLVAIRKDEHGVKIETPLSQEGGFDTPKEAADRGKVLAKQMDCQVQPRRVADGDAEAWKTRERGRLASGTYAPLPEMWNLPLIEDHFAHLSVKQLNQIAFTPSPEYGIQDRQVVMRPGAYIEKYHPTVGKDARKLLAAAFASAGHLRFATTEEEMVRVYKSGPESCMSGSFTGIGTHPASIYAAGDLNVAYLEDNDKRIYARCVCWPERKLFTRAYGEIDKIVAQLRAIGYQQENLIGAKLKKVLFKNRNYDTRELLVMPYLDEAHSRYGDPASVHVKPEGEHLVISRSGASTSSTNGFIVASSLGSSGSDEDDNSVHCSHCDDYYDADDMADVVVAIRNGGRQVRSWCDSCRCDSAFYCDGSDAYWSDSNFSCVTAVSGETWSDRYVEESGAFICPIMEAAYPASRAVVLANGERWSDDGFRENGFTCAGSGWKYDAEDTAYDVIDDTPYSNIYLETLKDLGEDNPVFVDKPELYKAVRRLSEHVALAA